MLLKISFSMRRAVIIVAGGSGTRMGGETPKQFLDLGGKPMIFHSIEAFYRYDRQIEVIVGVQDHHRELWTDLCTKHSFSFRHRLSHAGETRFHTVRNALTLTGENSIIAVHDAVRPLVSAETIERCFHTATIQGTAVPCVEIPDSVRKVAGTGNHPVDRASLRMMQTPQVFHSKILTEAYRLGYQPGFTDDAGVVEQAGHKIHLVEGNRENIKVTTRTDYLIAERMLNL
jgi:2-C-methyl-D-erythritol 4-phosphate cytidylyltransferase